MGNEAETMPRVDFYILQEETNQERFACKMIGKAWSQGNQVYVHTPSRPDAERLDDLLWTYRDNSFLPHALRTEEKPDDDTPVIIGWQDTGPQQRQVLMNLAPTVPDFATDFTRIIEIVAGDQERRQQARERYRQYRTFDCEMHDHAIDTGHDG